MSDDKSKKRGLFGWFGKKDETPTNESDSNSTPEELEEKLEQAEEALEQAIASKRVTIEGDAAQVDRLMASLDTFSSGFNIITPAVLSDN